MREIAVEDITKEIAKMCIQANHYLSDDMDKALKNATKEELLLVAKYPTQSVKIFNNSSTASNTASSLYKAETLYLGNGDAFRHAYWNALNLKSVGADIAKAFANAHESETPDGLDKTMTKVDI